MSEKTSELSVKCWTEDFWRAFLERPKFFRFICRIFMGKYAWSEIIGAKIELDKSHDLRTIGYSFDGDTRYLQYKDW